MLIRLFAGWLKGGWHEQMQPEVSEMTRQDMAEQTVSATDSS